MTLTLDINGVTWSQLWLQLTGRFKGVSTLTSSRLGISLVLTIEQQFGICFRVWGAFLSSGAGSLLEEGVFLWT